MELKTRRQFIKKVSLSGVAGSAIAFTAFPYSSNAAVTNPRAGMVLVDDYVEDGATTDQVTEGIQDAITEARSRTATLVFGSGVYEINDTLYLGKIFQEPTQKISGKSIPLIIGNGATIKYNFEAGVSDISKVIINYQGAPFSSIQNLNIESDTANIGLVLARDSDSRSSNRGFFSNIKIIGKFNHSALYMSSSESNLFQKCFFGNYSGIENSSSLIVEKESTVPNSDFGTSTNTYNRFTDCNFFSKGGSAIQLAACSGFFFENCIIDCSVGSTPVIPGVSHFEIINNTSADLSGSLSRSADITLEKCTFHGKYEHSIRLIGGGIMDQIKLRDSRYSQNQHATISHIYVVKEDTTSPLNLYNCEFNAPTIDLGEPATTPIVRIKADSLLNITQLYNQESSFQCSGPIQGQLIRKINSIVNIFESTSSGNPTTIRVRNVDTGEITQYPIL